MSPDKPPRRLRPHGPTDPPSARESAPSVGLPALLRPIGRRRRVSSAPRVSRILIVDDDPSLLRALKRMLRGFGHEVHTAEGGAAGLELLREGSFDLLLLDVLMPDVDGLQVLGEVRGDSRLTTLPVLMVSGADDLDMVVRCIELGAEDYLVKPANPTLLRARVDSCLSRKAAADRQQIYTERLETERERSNALLAAIFPAQVISELKDSGTIEPRRHEQVAVLFLDIVGFTAWCESHSVEEVVERLQGVFEALESVSDAHEIEKIKSIGDAFLATGGLLRELPNPTLACVKAGLAMIEAVSKIAPYWDTRVGVHVGPVMAGVVGHRQCLFDIWGDTVNTAARVEEAGQTGSVTISAAAFGELGDAVQVRSLGPVTLKGKSEKLELLEVLKLR